MLNKNGSNQNNFDSLDLAKSLQNIIYKIFKLDLNSDDDEKLLNCFKVLIFDDYTFNIISPLLKVKCKFKFLDLYFKRI